jgi:hypothetical protein
MRIYSFFKYYLFLKNISISYIKVTTPARVNKNLITYGTENFTGRVDFITRRDQ